MLHHLAHRADLGDAAGIHHRDPIRGLGDHAHVVRDQHHRRAVLARQPLEQGDDLRLDRHVERGRRLVGDDQPRLGAERERDHHALAHPARELVRISVDALPRGRDADLLQPADRACARVAVRQRQVRLHGLHELAADRVERVERGQRILEDGADLAAANQAHRLRREIVDALAVEPDFAAGDASGRAPAGR